MRSCRSSAGPTQVLRAGKFTRSIMLVCRLRAINERETEGLSELLMDCVTGGASVGFMLPMSIAKAGAYWRRVGADLARGGRLVFVGHDELGQIAGAVQVLLDQPENQPHRGEIAKMLVRRSARRRGLGAALLAAAESAAADAGKTLLVLDTASPDAERLYQRRGWQRCGHIPGYALMPDGEPCGTTVYYKVLRA